jgi:hypothetical protein
MICNCRVLFCRARNRHCSGNEDLTSKIPQNEEKVYDAILC